MNPDAAFDNSSSDWVKLLEDSGLTYTISGSTKESCIYFGPFVVSLGCKHN